MAERREEVVAEDNWVGGRIRLRLLGVLVRIYLLVVYSL